MYLFELMPSEIEYRILLALKEGGRMYGLQFVSRGVKRGTVYVTLGRMERQGLVVSERVYSTTPGPPLRYYSLTDKGRKVLEVVEQAEDQLRTLFAD